MQPPQVENHHAHHGHGDGQGHTHGHGHSEDKWTGHDYDAMPLIQQFSQTSSRGILDSLKAIGMSDATLKNLNACDIGAGTGQVTLALAPVFNSIHAIDTSPSMLKRLATRFPDNGNVTYSLLSLSLHAIDLLRSGAPLPAPTDEDETRQRVPPRTEFDIVYGSLMLHHVEDLESFFAGLQELVKPGGWVIFSEFGSAEEDRLAVAQAEAEAGISEEEAALQGKIAFPVGISKDPTDNVNQPGHHHQVWSKSSITDLFSSRGFTDIVVDFRGRLHWDEVNSIPLMVIRGKRGD